MLGVGEICWGDKEEKSKPGWCLRWLKSDGGEGSRAMRGVDGEDESVVSSDQVRWLARMAWVGGWAGPRRGRRQARLIGGLFT